MDRGGGNGPAEIGEGGEVVEGLEGGEVVGRGDLDKG